MQTGRGPHRALTEERSHVTADELLYDLFSFFFKETFLSRGSEIIWQDVGNNQQINKHSRMKSLRKSLCLCWISNVKGLREIIDAVAIKLIHFKALHRKDETMP